MKRFLHVDATSVQQASTALAKGKTVATAGGTDILGCLKDNILPDYPEVMVNLKTIPNMAYIREEGGMLKIGALTILQDIADSSVVKTKYTALAQAASRTASVHLREMGTIGGNICQHNRCWYFRAAENRFDCIRKGGNMCYAMAGDNRYHSIFGAVQACIAVNPSDTAPALVALNAKIVTNKQTIDAEKFWAVKVPGSTVLAADEIVTEIQVPTPAAGVKSAFLKFAIRKTIDFPVVNCAAMIGASDARICLNAVYNNPYRSTDAEAAVKGKTIDDTSAAAAGTAAVAKAMAMPANGSNPGNKYKVNITKTLVARTVLACK
jgi:xanthine dehydrogenase YagS FAD-binding subunit